jgi:hypothetical protein
MQHGSAVDQVKRKRTRKQLPVGQLALDLFNFALDQNN